MDRNTLIQRATTRQERNIYTSTVRKLEREVVHLVRKADVLKYPYLDPTPNAYWRRSRGILGFSILKRVIEETFRLRGWKIAVTAANSNYLTNGKHINLRVTSPYCKHPVEITAPLPVRERALWCPKRMGGIWTIFELHEGDCYFMVQNTIRELTTILGNELKHGLKEQMIHANTASILPTEHVCRMTGVLYEPLTK